MEGEVEGKRHLRMATEHVDGAGGIESRRERGNGVDGKKERDLSLQVGHSKLMGIAAAFFSLWER